MISNATVSLAFEDRYLEDALTVHHNVHAGQLTPDLREHADVSTIDHVWLEQLKVRDISVATLEFTHVFDLLEFLKNEWSISVAFSMDEGQYSVAFLPAVFASQPSRAFRQEKQTEEEDDSREHLKTPWHAESGWAAQVAAAE